MTKNKTELEERVKLIRSLTGNVLRTIDLISNGISTYEIQILTRSGFLERVRHGFYSLSDEQYVGEEELIAKFLPHAVVCVESALFHYGYSDFVPREWTLAVSRQSYRVVSKIDAFPMRAYYVADKYLSLGKTKSVFNGVELCVYDRERTICDCFKYKSKLDAELFVKAVKGYVSDPQKDLQRLMRYSKLMRLDSRIKQLMEVMLND